jgi:hypothetical protein
VTGVCTNHVEAYWKNAKRRFKAMSGSTLVPSHLDEYMWRERFGKFADGRTSAAKSMQNLMLHLSQWYPTA